jgi:predicted MPP superfamily phosphohydrolase
MLLIRQAVFFVLMTSLFGAINWFALRRARKAFQLGRKAHLALGMLLFGSLAGTLLGRVVGAVWQMDLGPVVPVSSIVQLSLLLTMGLLAPLYLVTAAHGVWRWLGSHIASRSDRLADPAAEAPSTPQHAADAAPGVETSVSRRQFLERAALGGSALVATSCSVYGTLSGRHDYRIEEVPLRIPGLKSTLDGFTIAQLSDIHIGDQVGEPELAAAWDLVQQCRPDLIVLTGDLLDNDPRFAEQLGRFARRLQGVAPHGVVAVTGNHDFYAGVDPTVRALERAGTRVLRNRGIVLGDAGGSFALLGVDDVMAPRLDAVAKPDLDAALRSVPSSADMPRVLLCHNPSYFEHAAGRVDLQLSGHTHGGQIRLGVSPADLFLWHGWVRGRYQHRGSELYVNRGFGTVGPPARIGAPPEVTRLVLHA